MSARPGASTAGNPYGFVDDVAREYVITRPDTPSPWLNYLGQGGFGGIISNTAGGFSFDRDPRNRRVTRYRYNGVPADQPGRYVYLRDQETGEFWSPTWQPVRRDLDEYECRHGASYTRIRGSLGGIECELLYFVPPDPDPVCPVEVWAMRIRNVGPARRVLRAFSYAEFGYLDAVADQQNLDWAQHIVSSTCEDGTIRVGTRFSSTTSFFASSRAPLGYTCDREAFVGRGRDLTAPVVVVTGKPENAPSPRGNSIGSLCHEFYLMPGEGTDLVYLLGATDIPSEIPGVVARYGDRREVDAAFARLRTDWDARLARFTVSTPDADTNAMLNTWNQVQCLTTLSWSRSVSGCETGLSRGMGTRDSAQDTLGVIHAVPGPARHLLDRTWAMQFRDGHTWHLFFPLTGEGSVGLAAESPAWPQWFSDDHLWLVLASCAYVAETGDTSYLDGDVAWADGGADTVWTHLAGAVEFTLANRGPHGLPRSGFADWDDTLNVDHGSGTAESVFAGMLFCRATIDLSELCEQVGRAREAERYRGLHHEMAAALNAAAWDGAWYLRAFDDDGRPVGGAGEIHHRINMAPQSWSIIGEVASRERAELAMRSADDALNTPFGVAMLTPPYDGFDERVRGTSTYPPGAKENGGIFCHANAWMIVAAAMLGRGDDAYRYYRQILPLGRTDADRYVAEPYVYAQNICGPGHPQYGMARNAWLTGTAAWTYVAATQWILGIRPTLRGLQVAPVIPHSWPGFRARRQFRGVVYDIEVRRAGPGGRVSLSVDGRPIDGEVVPLPVPGTAAVSVEAIIA
jgi:cellobiose phosphorylase